MYMQMVVGVHAMTDYQFLNPLKGMVLYEEHTPEMQDSDVTTLCLGKDLTQPPRTVPDTSVLPTCFKTLLGIAKTSKPSSESMPAIFSMLM